MGSGPFTLYNFITTDKTGGQSEVFLCAYFMKISSSESMQIGILPKMSNNAFYMKPKLSPTQKEKPKKKKKMVVIRKNNT